MLKISVLSSGAVLLDGKPVGLSALDEALKKHKEKNSPVWYYRESSGSEPVAQGMQVINLVVKHQLPISLSSKPDFSDYVDANGSHPRKNGAAPAEEPVAGCFEPRMPEVEAKPNIERLFAGVRKVAAGETGVNGLILVRPDRKFLILPKLNESPALKASAAAMDRVIPAAVKRKIAVIAYTGFAMQKPDAAPTLANAGKAIPFLGMLMGLTYIGHTLWIFEGHPSALAAGCRDADVLLVDSGMLPFLPKGWPETAAAAMRNPNIICRDRATSKIRFVKISERTSDRLQFVK